jgi:hypothetical protein
VAAFSLAAPSAQSEGATAREAYRARKAQTVARWSGKHRDLGRYRKQNFGVASGFERCPRCGSEPTTQGHDACLANLPGVVNACCGHGLMPPYATLSSGFCLRGKALLIYLEKVGKLERFWRGVTSRSDHP